jgi:hypothetical protein
MNNKLETLAKFNFDGVLNYITQYKQLTIKCDEEQAQGIKSKLDELYLSKNLSEDTGDKKVPYNLSDDGFYYLVINLDKYEKPNIRKYEKFLKSKMKLFIDIDYYKSDEYGAGLTLKLTRLRKIL